MSKTKKRILIISISVLIMLLLLCVYKYGQDNSDKAGGQVCVAQKIKNFCADFIDDLEESGNRFREKREAKRRQKKATKNNADYQNEREGSETAPSGLMFKADYVMYGNDPDKELTGNSEVETIEESCSETTAVSDDIVEIEGVVFRPMDDFVYVSDKADLFESPKLTGEPVISLEQWTMVKRVGISSGCVYRFLMDGDTFLYGNGRCFSREREDMELTEDVIYPSESILLDVPYVPQYPTLPNGCEVTSLTQVLNYYGFDVKATYVTDNFMPKKPQGKANFYYEYVGSPYDGTGFGIYSQGIVETAEKFLLTNNNTQYAVRDISGSSVSDLLTYVCEGTPVIVWTGYYMAVEPTLTVGWIVDGEFLRWKGNLHCIVLTGYDSLKDVLCFTDPARGKTTIPTAQFVKRYKQFYSQAVLIENVSEEASDD